MGVIFFGATKLGFECCKAIIDEGVVVDAIFTIEKEYSIKYKSNYEKIKMTNVLFEDFSYFNLTYNIPVINFINNKSDQYIEYINDIKPDLIIVIGWYYNIPNAILSIPNKGSIAIHASLLPKYRGNAPLVWAMINGEKQTGVSLFFLEGDIDSGDIIAQKSFQINDNDTIKNVLKKAEKASIMLIKKYIKTILTLEIQRHKQKHSEATYYPKRTPKDGEIDWSWDNDRINRFIRAQTRPYPGAYTFINGKKITIFDGKVEIHNEEVVFNYNI